MTEQSLAQTVARVAAAAEALEQLKKQLSTPPLSTEFLVICDRWWQWRARWRRPGERLKYDWSDVKPHFADLNAEDTDADELYFREEDRDGDWKTNSMPVAYFQDPDAWEAAAEVSGRYVNAQDRLAQEEAAQGAARVAQAQRELERATRVLREAGYGVRKNNA